jgi:hypothetical protein
VFTDGHASDAGILTGAYQRPHRPAGAATLPANLLQIDVEDYRNPAHVAVAATREILRNNIEVLLLPPKAGRSHEVAKFKTGRS